VHTADPLTDRRREPAAGGLAVAPPLAHPWPGRLRAALRRAAPALAGYGAARLLGLVCAAVWSWHIGLHPRQRLGNLWDAEWYGRIASYGYGTIIPSPYRHGVFYDDRAFFPLYPGLIRAVDTVLPIGEVNAALLVSWVCAAVAAWGIYMVGERLRGRRVGALMAVLWGLLPHSIIESMAYTESLLTAFAVWSLYAVLTRRWLWSGILAAGAGLTRPNGIAVAAAVCSAAAVEVYRRRGGTGWRVWAAATAAPSGWLGYMLLVGRRTGRLDGYFAVQRKWGSEFDFGVSTSRFVRFLVLERSYLVSYVSLAVVVVAVLLLVHTVADRQPLPLVVYSAVLLVISLGGTNYFQCKPRFLLPAFALLMPVADALARARARTLGVVLGGLTLLSAFYGTYLVTISRWSL
jgi:Dolichyl-phosphate-mannose-protein mannosyltransferase